MREAQRQLARTPDPGKPLIIWRFPGFVESDKGSPCNGEPNPDAICPWISPNPPSPLTPPGTAPPARHAGRPAVPRPPGRRSCAPPAASGAARGPSRAGGAWLPQQLPPALVQRAMTVQLRAGQGRVGLVLTFQLPPTAGRTRSRTAGEASPAARPGLPGPPAASADAGRCGPARGRRRGPRSAPPGRACRRRPAPDVRATRRARIHGRDQLEAGRKPRRAHGPRDQHPAGFQRLAQRFQRASVEFGQ